MSATGKKEVFVYDDKIVPSPHSLSQFMGFDLSQVGIHTPMANQSNETNIDQIFDKCNKIDKQIEPSETKPKPQHKHSPSPSMPEIEPAIEPQLQAFTMIT